MIGKGGPDKIGDHEVEFDVRLVYVKVTGTPILDLEVEKGALRASSPPTAVMVKARREATKKQHAPRFDSSDSEMSDASDNPDYYDSFVS